MAAAGLVVAAVVAGQTTRHSDIEATTSAPFTTPGAPATTPAVSATTIASTTITPATIAPATIAPATTAPATTTTALATTVAPTTVTTAAPQPQPGAPDGEPALDVLARIPVTNEHGAGYDRGRFPTWLDLDGDGCDARAQVLIRESTTQATVGSGCHVTAGAWLSTYDGTITGNPGELEIDHVVALKEAWDSGAYAWSDERRVAYANDVTDARTLHAVSVASNQSKGNADPSNWMPPDRGDWCRYLGDVVSIKARWSLSMDQSEAGRIRNLFEGECAGLRIAPGAALPPYATPPPTTAAVPPNSDVYYENCNAARAAGAAPIHVGEPGYRPGLDRDHDGVACE